MPRMKASLQIKFFFDCMTLEPYGKRKALIVFNCGQGIFFKGVNYGG